MSLRKAVANALSFASLAGLSPAKGSRAESDDKDKDKDEKAEDDGSDAKAEEDEDKKPKDKGDEGSKGSKGAKSEEEKDEKEDDDEDDSKPAASATLAPRAGIPAERNRCKAIVAHGVKLSVAAGGDLGPVIDACMLAFDTDVSAEAAISNMDARLAAAGSLRRTGNSLHSRMQGEQHKQVRADGGESAAPGSVTGTVQMILAAAKKARGEA